MSPVDLKLYPFNWPEIVAALKFNRAGNRCEWCGRHNHSYDGAGKKHVLTVAHLGVDREDGTPGDKADLYDCRAENLAVLCDVCHLQFDRNSRVSSPGQLSLPGLSMPGMPAFNLPAPAPWPSTTGAIRRWACCVDELCTVDTCSLIPEPFTCEACCNFIKCLDLGTTEPGQAACDWFPTRFRPRLE